MEGVKISLGSSKWGIIKATLAEDEGSISLLLGEAHMQAHIFCPKLFF